MHHLYCQRSFDLRVNDTEASDSDRQPEVFEAWDNETFSLDITTLPKVLSKTGELEWQKSEVDDMSGSRRFKI